MDYVEQQQFLTGSRIWGAVCVLLLLILAGICFVLAGPVRRPDAIVFWLVTIALAFFLYYTPDYLHLTVTPEKRARWAVKIRWRLIAAALIVGLLATTTVEGRVVALIATAWLVTFNLLARFVPARFVGIYFWLPDFLLIVSLLVMFHFSVLLASVLFAGIYLLLYVSVASHPMLWPKLMPAPAAAVVLLWIAASHDHSSIWLCLALVTLPSITFFATAWLVHRAEQRNQKNIAVAMQELEDFTKYPPDRIRQLWATSNQQLAQNWKEAGIAPDDSERLAEWYRQNSELYLFAISGYNLEYKRIRATLNVLKLARGDSLDYGAGNGEVLLELGKLGHAVAYYDVAGETMRFARLRAQQRRAPLMFFHSKEGLTRSNCHFDTVYALDVLEHLPDLAGELDFLSSLLKPGGLLVFDVPAGATKSHPMHLNHDLDVVTYLKARGLSDARTFRQRMPFRKEEKYFFRKPAATA